MGKKEYLTQTRPELRSIILRYNGEIIRPGQAFEILYSGLDTLIDAVVDSYTSRGRKGKMEARFRTEKAKNEGYLKWIRWANKSSSHFGLDAQVVFDDNSVRKYVLFPRTNFDAEGLKKRPSIIWMRDLEGGDALILREARTYDLESFVAPFVRRTYWNKFDLEVTKQFYGPVATRENILPPKQAGVMFLPEPQLLAGLERMMGEVWIERLTPKPYAIDATEDKLWYLREHISTLVADVTPTMEDLGNYFGQMQALGLVEELDRQMIHYGYDRGVIVNYDPDFMVHSTSDTLVRQRDFNDLKEVMGSEAKNLLVSFDLIKKAIDQRRKLAEQTGITKTTLLDYIPRKITMDPFAKVELKL